MISDNIADGGFENNDNDIKPINNIYEIKTQNNNGSSNNILL